MSRLQQLCAKQDAKLAKTENENACLRERLRQVNEQLRDLSGVPPPLLSSASKHATVCLMCNRGYGVAGRNDTLFSAITALCGCKGAGQLCAENTLPPNVLGQWLEGNACHLLPVHHKCYKCRQATTQ